MRLRAFCIMSLRVAVTGQVNPFRGVSEAKASLNGALLVGGCRRETR